MTSSTAIAIIGMAGRFPGAMTLEKFWFNLQQGIESIQRFTPEEMIACGVPSEIAHDPSYVPAKGIVEDIAGFDAAFFGYSPREASYMDPQHRVFLECAWEALEHSGYDPLVAPTTIGLYAGCGDATYLYHLLQSKKDLAEAAKDPSVFFGNYRDFFATRVAYRLNLRGPSLNIQTACSTSLVAIHEACSALLSYQCDMAVAGGIHLSLPHKSGNFHEKGAVVSPDGHCRAFDAQGAGTVASDGAGVVILKRYEDALADGDTIHAVILGSAVNNDGADKIGYTAPSVSGQAEVITMAQEFAAIAPSEISYIEAHGTGTPLGDPIEIKALTQSFTRETQEKEYCAIGSLKTNLGHLDAAAGVAGLIKTVLALQHQEIPASLNFTAPNPEIDFTNSPFYVNDRLRPWVPRQGRRIAGVSSFGIGGTNAHVIVSEAPEQALRASKRPAHLLTLSARSEHALTTMAQRLSEYLSDGACADLGDVGYTLQEGRHSFEHRLSLVATDQNDAIGKLNQTNSEYKKRGRASGARKQIAFLFPGQGLQCVNMGRALYENEEVFKNYVDQGLAIAAQNLNGMDLRTLLYPAHESEQSQALTQTRYAQPALFIIEYALARYLESLGVRGDVMLGHSIGEWVAGCLAGVFSFEDAIRLVCARAKLMQACEPGAMLGVELTEHDLLPLLEKGLEISVYNADSWLIVSGGHAQIEDLHQRLLARDVVCHALRVSHAFHSASMEPAAQAFTACFKDVVLLAPQRPFVSNITGDWITEDQACSPHYWAQQLRAPVRFHNGLAALNASSDLLLLEVGPGRALARFAAMSGPVNVTSVWPQPQQNAFVETLSAIGSLWVAGLTPHWAALHQSEPRGRVPLPTYPFEHVRYWVDSNPIERKQPETQQLIESRVSAGRSRVAIEPPRKNPNLSEWFFKPEWQKIPTNLNPDAKYSDVPTLIILGSETILGETYLEIFSRAQIVRPGTQFRQLADNQFEVELNERQSYEDLFTTLAKQNKSPQRIIQAINLEPVTKNEPDAEQALRRYIELLSLAQAIGKCLHNQKIELIVLANQLCGTPGMSDVQADKASLLGPAKVIPLEYPGVSCRVFDLDSSALSDPAVLLNELRQSSQERLVAYREGQRWVERYVSQPLAEQVPNNRLRQRGVYLITGGLGGVGLALAEHLVRTVQAKILLVNRSAFPAPEMWQSVLQSKNLPELSAQLPALQRSSEAFSRDFAIATLDQYPGLQDSLRSLAQRCIQRYFSSVVSPSERISISELRDRLRLHPRFERMFQFMLGVLQTAAGIELTDDALQMPPMLPVAARETAEKYPAFRGLIEFIDYCTQDYPKALSGEIPSIQVLYPDGKTTRLDALQKNTIEYSQQRIYSHVLKDHLLNLARIRPLRILEVGGGQGLLTSVLAPELLAMGCSYHFTDISPYFINRILDVRPELHGMTTGIFDLTRDPLAQGLDLETYDVIVGLDVVHATPNISVTIGHLRMLLAPSGYLGLLETVSTGPWVDLCWGLADGWWLYEDQELRHSALMHAEQWETAIAQSGFALHAVLPVASTARAVCDVALVLAQLAPGEMQTSLSAWQAEASKDPVTIARYRIKKLQELEQLGGEVAVVTADIGETSEVARVVAFAKERFGAIHGVIHSAMVLEDKLMQLKDPQSARRVFAPKVQGSLNLIAALKDQSLDFFAHCSSLAAPMGLYAQSDYCAATSFQDALAHTMMPGVSLSINWGVWRDAGFAMRMKLESVAARQQWQSLSGPILRRKLVTEDGRIVFEGTLSEQWVVAEHYLDDMATLPGTGYLSLINESMHAIKPGSFRFDNLVFSEPLTVTPPLPQSVRLLFEPESQGYQVKVASLRGDQWIEHARALVSLVEQNTSSGVDETNIDLSNLKQQFNFEESVLQSRTQADQSLLIYRSVAVGPRWQGLTRWHSLQAQQALALIELPARFESDFEQYPLHPALLDIATSFAMGDEAFYLPLAYDKVTLHAPLSRKVWSHITWERNADSQAPTISFAIRIFNDDGALALAVQSYTLRQIGEPQPAMESRRLLCETPGLLDSLTYVPLAPLTIEEDEVEIRVVSTGLNFLDVLTALDMSLSLSDQEKGIGRECAGIITRVGRNVRHLRPGNEVIAITSHAYDDLLVVDQQSVRLKPEQMSWEVAASVAVPFMTAHFALNHRAKIRAGESVLIHAAAGGVGLAAVQLALNVGAKIYATAGSEEKRDYLRSLGITHVYDSRSISFAEEIRLANGGGVDVVLNSLGGDLMLASLGLLAPHGRFLELGKRDFAENRQIGMAVFAAGVTYYSINLGPDLIEYDLVFDEVMAMLANQEIYPLPVLVYPVQETAKAFADMASARHIGKLVVARPNHPVKHRTVVEFSGVDAPMEDPQLREGMSSQEGAQAFDRALASGLTQILVTPQDFPSLLRLNTPAQIRSNKENLAQQSMVIKTSVAVPVIASAVEQNDTAAIVAESWQKFLGLTQIDQDDNFFKLGGDSLIGIQIMAYLRKRLSIEVPVAIFFEAPTLKELTQALEKLSGKKTISSAEESTLKLTPTERHAPFALTDVQQAYWIGRSGAFELGNVAAHGYFEVERSDLDYERFCLVWMLLVRRHDMLRMIVNADGQQQILAEVPDYRPELIDLRLQTKQDAERAIVDVRHRMSSQILPSDQWPLFDIRVSLLPDSTTRIHMSFDALIMDAWSSMILGREFSELYKNTSTILPTLELSFRDYVLAEQAERQTAAYEVSKRYWLDRLDSLPPAPDLPLRIKPEELDKPTFTRRNAFLSRTEWTALKKNAARAGLTPSIVCLTCFSDVLGLWSQSARFSINLTLFNRPPVHPQINDVVGDFTSLTLLEIETSAARTFVENAQRIQQQLGRDLDHRRFSGVEVLRELVRSGRRHSGAIMPVVFTSTLALESQQQTHSPVIFDGEVVYGISQTPQVWLDHGIVEEDGKLSLNWNAVEALLPEDMLDDMFESYRNMLLVLASSPDRWNQRLNSTLPPAQLARREAYNNTDAIFNIDRLEAGFFEQAAKYQNTTAVFSTQGPVLYGEIAERAISIANGLSELGMAPGECVGVHLSKGWQQVAAALGILKAGGAYVALDPSLPESRLISMSEGMRFAISTLTESAHLPVSLKPICFEDLLLNISAVSPAVSLDDLAYVIFTSGSTGRPKGVMIQHRAVMNTIADLVRRFELNPSDRVLALSAMGFDLSVFDMFALLGVGGAIVMPDAQGLREPDHWHKLMVENQVTIWNSVPALLELLVDYVESNALDLPHSLRLIMLSGDWIPVGLPERIKKLLPTVTIIGMGGATEASIWSIYYPVKKVDPAWTSIPYGYPLANQTYYVLNAQMQSCPEWVTGELFIGGTGLSSGYWKDPEQSAYRYPVIDGKRLYRTGDQGRFRPEGWIEFQGRNDNQVKVQGYRIELAEIEAVLRQHPQVNKCAVKALGLERNARKLAAYFVPNNQQALPTTDSLRQFLLKQLPEYMVPLTFTMIERLPLSGNGKVDYASLPDPLEQVLMPVSSDVTPNPVRAKVLGLIAELLKLPSVSPQANLLDLGADSITVIRLANRLQAELSIRPSVAELYRMQRIEELLQFCEKNTGETTADFQEDPVESRSERPAFRLITDPVERQKFKDSHSAIRTFSPGQLAVSLGSPAEDTRVAKRRSQRQFSLRPIELTDMGKWLSALCPRNIDGQNKYLYASAGGLYPVQTYIFVKAGRISGLSEGLYYHDPAQHQLVLVTTRAVIHRDDFDPFLNRTTFDESAFCLFFVSAMTQIEPLYGEHSEKFASIETGLMLQTLDLHAIDLGIGLCHIGDFEADKFLAELPKDDRPRLILSALGGLVNVQEEARGDDKLARALARVAELSPEQVRNLLLAKQGQRK